MSYRPTEFGYLLRLHPERLRALILEQCKPGLTLVDVSRNLGVSKSSLIRAMRQLDLHEEVRLRCQHGLAESERLAQLAHMREAPNLEKALILLGLTDAQFGEMVGVDATTVGRWRRGETKPRDEWPYRYLRTLIERELE